MTLQLRTTQSPSELIRTWVLLEDAYNGVANYGGDVAEIYAGQLGPYRHWKSHVVTEDEFAAEAARSLSDLLAFFCEIRRCEAEIVRLSGVDAADDKPGMFDGTCPPFSHRVHVRIIPTTDEDV